MTDTKNNRVTLVTKNPCVILGNSIVEPMAYQQGATPNYYAQFGITDPQEAQEIWAAAQQAFINTVGQPTGDIQSCVKTGEQAANELIQAAQYKWQNTPEYQSKVAQAEERAAILRPFILVVSVSTNYAPMIGHFVNGNITEITPSERENAKNNMFYNGAKAYFEFQLYGRKRKNFNDKDGISGFLQCVLFHSHGTRLGGGGQRNIKEVFKGFSGVSSIDPTAPAAPQGFAPSASPQMANGYNPQGFAPAPSYTAQAMPAAPAPMVGQSFPTGNFAPPQAPVAPAAPQYTPPTPPAGYTPAQGGFPTFNGAA